MNNETSTSEPNETVYRAVTFDVLAGNEYEIYAKGGSGVFFSRILIRARVRFLMILQMLCA